MYRAAAVLLSLKGTFACLKVYGLQVVGTTALQIQSIK